MPRRPQTKTKIDVHASLYCESLCDVIKRGALDVEVYEWEAEPWLKAGWATLSSEREEVDSDAHTFRLVEAPSDSRTEGDDEHAGTDDRHLGSDPGAVGGD